MDSPVRRISEYGTSSLSPVLLIAGDSGDADRLRRVVLDAGVPGPLLAEVPRLSDGLLALARQRFSALVMNTRLPDASGVSALAQVRLHDDATPVVLVSPEPCESERALAIEVGAQEYLGLPSASGATLGRCLEAARVRKQAENQLRCDNDRLAGEVGDHRGELTRLRQELGEARAAREASQDAQRIAGARLAELEQLDAAYQRMHVQLEQRHRDFADLTTRLLEEIERSRTQVAAVSVPAPAAADSNTVVSGGLRDRIGALTGELSRISDELRVARAAQLEVEAAWRRRRHLHEREVRDLQRELAEARAARVRLEGGVTSGAGAARPSC